MAEEAPKLKVVPLPEQLPGAFFVLVWERDEERFVLYVDDADQSSYQLGSDIARIMMLFRLRGLKDIGNRSIDIAKEFGAAQAIPAQDRVIPIYDRNPRRALVWKEEESYAGYLPDLT